MPTVNIPNVGKVNFPEGMSEEEIHSAIEADILPKAAVVPKPPADTRSFGRKATDYVKSYGSGLNEAAKSLNKASLDSTPGLVGAADAGASVVSSALAPFAAGIDKTLGAVFPGTRDAGNPENDYDKLKAKYQYEPRTDTGKAITSGLGALFAPVADLTNATSDKLVDAAQFEYKYPDGTRKAGISPETAAQAREMLPDALGLAAAGPTRAGRAAVRGVANAPGAVATALDTPLRYRGNVTKAANLEFQEVGGRNIDIQAKPGRPESAQRREIGKFVLDNRINEARSAAGETPVDAKLRVTRDIKQQAGQSIGQNDAIIDSIAQQAGVSALRVPTRLIRQQIRRDPLLQRSGRFNDAANPGVLRVYTDALTEMGKVRGMSYDDLAQLKQVFNDRIDWKNGDSATNTAAKKIWHTLDDAQDVLLTQADQLGRVVGGDTLLHQVRTDKYNYRLASDVEEGLVKQAKQGPEFDGIRRYFKPKTKTGAMAALLAGAAGAATPVPYFLGAVPAAYAGGKLGDRAVAASLRSRVRNSQHYTQGP